MVSKDFNERTGGCFCTKRLVLERFTQEDCNFFINVANDYWVNKYFKRFRKRNLKRYFYEEVVGTQSAYNLALVIRQKNGTPVGFINFFYIQSGEWLCEYAISESYRRRGYITEVLNTVCEKNIEFLLTFRCNAVMNSLVFEVNDENYVSTRTIKKFIQSNNLYGETSMHSFFTCFKSRFGETWYRVRIA